MLDTIIIDDERLAQDALIAYIKRLQLPINIIAVGSNAQEGIKLIEEWQPDLVFLDIEMQAENGFDMLNLIDEVNFQIIFTTAFDHYAIRAIKISALDYLLKPIEGKELTIAVNKAIEMKNHIGTSRVSYLLNSMKKGEDIDRLTIPDRSSFINVMLKDIISLNAQGSYTRFDLINGTNHLTCKNIKEYEEILPANYFIRIHRSSIVNVNHITRYRRGDGGVVELINGMSMKVSRKRKEEFLRMYGVKKLT